MHCAAPAVCEKAAHAAAVAMTMSWPAKLSGEEAGRNTSGAAPLTLSAAGKAMAPDSASEALPLLALAPHVSDDAVRGSCGGCTRHCPALAAVVFALAQHWHAEQPLVSMAAPEQQQPPKHALVPQSALLPQASPGESKRHAPVPEPQAKQPARAAVAEQHAPPRHSPEAQEVLSAQASPAGA